LFGATVVDFANVTVASDLAYSGGNTTDTTTLAGGVTLTCGSLFQDSIDIDGMDFGATGHLNVDADVYMTNLGITNTQDSDSDKMALDVTCQLNLNADVYAMSLGAASGSAPRSDYNKRRNNACTNECTQLFLRTRNTSGIASRRPWSSGSPCTFENSEYNDSPYQNQYEQYALWNISRDCEYVPNCDGICTDGGLGASDPGSYLDGQDLDAQVFNGQVYDAHSARGYLLVQPSESSCALGTDCTDCSALNLTYANVTFVAEYVLASGDSSSIGTSFTLTTNSGDNEFIEPLIHAELRLDVDIHLGEDSVSATVAMNDKFRQEDKQGNFEIRLAFDGPYAPNPLTGYVALHFDLDVLEDDGKYNVSIDMTLADDLIISVGAVSNSNAGALNVRVEAPESLLLPSEGVQDDARDGLRHQWEHGQPPAN
jgi:hypothetical protein